MRVKAVDWGFVIVIKVVTGGLVPSALSLRGLEARGGLAFALTIISVVRISRLPVVAASGRMAVQRGRARGAVGVGTAIGVTTPRMSGYPVTRISLAPVLIRSEVSAGAFMPALAFLARGKD